MEKLLVFAAKIMVPYSITMYVFFVATLVLGLAKFKPAKTRLKIHKTLAIISIIMATIHGTMNLIIY